MALVANFTGATDTVVTTSYTADSGDTFKTIYVSSGVFKLTNNNRLYVASGSAWLCSNTNSPSADSTVECTIYYLSDTSTVGGLSVRSGGPSQAYGALTFYGYMAVHLNGIWYMYKCTAGSSLSQIGTTASQTLTANTGYKMKLSAIGSTITLYTDNADGTYVQRIQVTDTSITAAGAPGIWLGNSSYPGDATTGYHIDSMFEVVVATGITMTGPTSGVVGSASTNFTVGANGSITGTVTVTPSSGGGGGTFTPSTVDLTSGSPTATFTYTAASSGNKTISITNSGSLTNPSNITYTAAAAATATTLTGPTTGYTGAQSTDFTVGANGNISGTVIITPATTSTGVFVPTTVSINNASPTGTFKYTPTIAGTHTISNSNNGGLTVPSNIIYTASTPAATAVTMSGPTACIVGAASTNFTIGANGSITGTIVVTPSSGGGGGTFTPTTVSISNATPSVTFTYTAASTGTKPITVVNDGSLSNPGAINCIASTAATAVTMAGPSTGLVSTASTNFTIGANGGISGTVIVTPSDGGASGTFTPSTVSINSSSPTAVFTYTPSSTPTAVTITSTNNGGLSTTPSSLTYTSTAATGTISMIGPSAGTVNIISSVFTVTISGNISGSAVVTPASNGGGTFSPANVTLTGSTRTATFTYTPTTNGSKTISITNSGGHTNPANLTYVVATASSLVIGAAALVSTSSSNIIVNCGSASGGTSPYTYEWHRDLVPDFVIGDHNKLVGANSVYLVDSNSLSLDISYYYRCRVIDNLGAVSDSKIAAGVLKYPPLILGFIGDSITAGQNIYPTSPPSLITSILSKMYKNRDVYAYNQAHGGATTVDWAPGSNYLNTARTVFSGSGVTHVHIMLGANDGVSITPAAYTSNMLAIINVLLADGFKVIVSYPTFIPDGPAGRAPDPTYAGRLYAYCTCVDNLVNGTTILRGDTLSYNYFISNYAVEYTSDEVHPSVLGATSIATMWARAIDRVLYSPDRPVPTKTVSVSFRSRVGTIQANLTGLKWSWSDIQGNVIDVGTGATTNAQGVFTITVHTYLPSGGTGYLEVNNAAGVVNTTYLSFSGPVVVT